MFVEALLTNASRKYSRPILDWAVRNEPGLSSTGQGSHPLKHLLQPVFPDLAGEPLGCGVDGPRGAPRLLGLEVVSLQEAGVGQGRPSCCWDRFEAGQTNTGIKIRLFILCQDVSRARLVRSLLPSLTSCILWD